MVGAFVLLASAYIAAWPALAKKPAANDVAGREHLDFGWTPELTLGPMISAFAAAAPSQSRWRGLHGGRLRCWPRFSRRITLPAICVAPRASDHVPLPMVDLLSSDHDLVLDAGCGAGRTTLAVSRILRNGKIVALDRFDSGYIADGGRQLLENNLRLAGLSDRVEVCQGDITDMPFGDAKFDSAVSTHAMDHLGRQTEQGLREVLRVLSRAAAFFWWCGPQAGRCFRPPTRCRSF